MAKIQKDQEDEEVKSMQIQEPEGEMEGYNFPAHDITIQARSTEEANAKLRTVLSHKK